MMNTTTRIWSIALGLMLGAVPGGWTQQGDKQGEEQVERVPRELIPPAPPLPPEQALQTFKLPPGLRMELVAAEPLVDTPVAIDFDARGRLWVVEMRGFMPNPDGVGEQDIPGRIAILEDVDGDGQADRRKVFLDDLVMPRALAVTGQGVLVGEPPRLWFCRDKDGDDRCDEKTLVAEDYGSQQNPEHTANGLVWAIDNWYYNLYHTYRYRYREGKWDRQAYPNRVQWGLAQDDFGRLYFTSNSDQLRGDLFPAHYVGTDPQAKLPGLNVRVAGDQTVWPGRVNPGVNRGYQPNTLRPDGRLARFTAACGTTIYRGHLLGEDYSGNAFVCEPSANLIRRNSLQEKEGVVEAVNAHGEGEFLTSTDERFRPVNLATGPEGALYVVDIYHGIIQHRVYLTTYLRQQAESRGLDKPNHMGRIYRIVPEGSNIPPGPNLDAMKPGAWVEHLSHPNGWVRDTAQRLLVERGGADLKPALQRMALEHGNPLARLHALWVLDGLDLMEVDTVLAALSHPHPKLRRAGLRHAEHFLRVHTLEQTVQVLRAKLAQMVNDPAEEVRHQLALSLGAISFSPPIRETLVQLEAKDQPVAVQKAAAFSLALREPVKTGAADQPVVDAKPLSKEHQALFDQGREVFELTCIACHQAHGLGQEGLAPPLVGSEWVAGSPERLARIVLHGLRGPIQVKGDVVELDMPALGILDDDQIAGVLTFVRRQWGHAFDPVDPALVRKVREATADREDAWTAEELLKLP